MVPLHYSSGASFQHISSDKIRYLPRTITLQFWGILPTRIWTLVYWGLIMYHYITVLGHPSNLRDKTGALSALVPLHYSSGASFQQWSFYRRDQGGRTITLQFWGILPTETVYHIGEVVSTITLQFWGILPTKNFCKTSQSSLYHYITVLGHPSNYWRLSWRRSDCVPLHYSSGASFQPSPI